MAEIGKPKTDEPLVVPAPAPKEPIREPSPVIVPEREPVPV